MTSSSRAPKDEATTLSLDEFWEWLDVHRGCILRVSTATAALFDHEDHHWLLLHDEQEPPAVQLLRGKHLVGEIVLEIGDIAYVQCMPGEGEEVAFELMVEEASSREIAVQFLMAHGYDSTEMASSGHWTH